ncbi:hypothetical protein Q5M85_05860 [Paraclostridium bifermentans]|nr:hypothetical protein [Paraclostridium bifermentans]
MMVIKTNKNRLILGLKILFVVIILGITAKESANIISGFNIETFYTYADQLTLGNILIIISLGIISYIPLTFYDFIIKKRVGINLDNKNYINTHGLPVLYLVLLDLEEAVLLL